MPDEDQLSLRQADQIRGDLYGLQDDLDFIKVQLARLPTRKTDRPLEPIKMEIATAHRLETRLISKNDPSEGTGDVLAEVLTPFRKHIENTGPTIEAKRCFPGGPES